MLRSGPQRNIAAADLPMTKHKSRRQLAFFPCAHGVPKWG